MARKQAGHSKLATKAVPRKRRRRARPVPKWLKGRPDLDPVAQRRALMVLSALSGEKSVTAIVEELGISRPLYYHLETKALVAMLQALAPGADAAASPDAVTPAQKMADLEAKVTRLEREKRRLERLLYLTRKIVRPGPIALPSRRGRKPKAPGSTSAGPKPSRSSTSSTKPATSAASSMPTADGATTP